MHTLIQLTKHKFLTENQLSGQEDLTQLVDMGLIGCLLVPKGHKAVYLLENQAQVAFTKT